MLLLMNIQKKEFRNSYWCRSYTEDTLNLQEPEVLSDKIEPGGRLPGSLNLRGKSDYGI